nr:MAG TPA: hypothetical protein [Caudoviricetes sp.]
MSRSTAHAIKNGEPKTYPCMFKRLTRIISYTEYFGYLKWI